MFDDPYAGRMPGVCTCDACRREIVVLREGRLVRAQDALPEEPCLYVHAACFERFVRERGGRWEAFTFSSPTAAWFLPVMRRTTTLRAVASARPAARPAFSARQPAGARG